MVVIREPFYVIRSFLLYYCLYLFSFFLNEFKMVWIDFISSI